MVEIKDNDIEIFGYFDEENREMLEIYAGKTKEEAEQLKKQILQSLRLLDSVKNTTIDLTPRERSLLDLLLEQSRETKTQESQS